MIRWVIVSEVLKRGTLSFSSAAGRANATYYKKYSRLMIAPNRKAFKPALRFALMVRARLFQEQVQDVVDKDRVSREPHMGAGQEHDAVPL
jgi:hypothetical protein